VETPEDGNEGAGHAWPEWTDKSDWQVKQEYPYDGDYSFWGLDWKDHQQSGGWNDQLGQSWDDQQGQSRDDNKG